MITSLIIALVLQIIHLFFYKDSDCKKQSQYGKEYWQIVSTLFIIHTRRLGSSKIKRDGFYNT